MNKKMISKEEFCQTIYKMVDNEEIKISDFMHMLINELVFTIREMDTKEIDCYNVRWLKYVLNRYDDMNYTVSAWDLYAEDIKELLLDEYNPKDINDMISYNKLDILIDPREAKFQAFHTALLAALTTILWHVRNFKENEGGM